MAAPAPDRLAADRTGAGSRIVLVHGFTQTARCWGPLPADLSTDHEVVAVDAPGHGGSGAVRADLPAGAARIGDAGGRGVYVGYSMGGRFALRLALDRPELVRGLLLVGATAGIEDPGQRAARGAADDARAARLERIGVAAFVDEWLRLPLFASLPPERACRQERLRNTIAGLASSLRLAGTGAQEPLWDRVAELQIPVVVAAGEHDDKFRAIAARLCARIGGNARAVVVPAAGHSAHLEQPEAVTAIIREVCACVA